MSPWASSRNIAKLSSPSASIWARIEISQGRYRRSEKNLAESREIFPLLAMPTSIAPIFFRRTHLPFTWLLRSNAYWFSGRLLTYRPCISNLLHQEKNFFSYFYICFYICIYTSPSFSSSLFLPFPLYLFIYFPFFFNRILPRQSSKYKY